VDVADRAVRPRLRRCRERLGPAGPDAARVELAAWLVVLSSRVRSLDKLVERLCGAQRSWGSSSSSASARGSAVMRPPRKWIGHCSEATAPRMTEGRMTEEKVPPSGNGTWSCNPALPPAVTCIRFGQRWTRQAGGRAIVQRKKGNGRGWARRSLPATRRGAAPVSPSAKSHRSNFNPANQWGRRCVCQVWTHSTEFCLR
jgi:hypothetical protein